MVSFKAKLFKIGSWTIARLPESESAKLPSRGIVMVEGTINGFGLRTVLEPDGKGSHWLRVDKAMQEGGRVAAGDTVTIVLEPTDDWVRPEVPADFEKALAAAPTAQSLWTKITPNAQWDWVRWIRAVKTPETRQKHIKVALDKLNRGTRRPCCFNRNLCTVPEVSNNWVLLTPKQTLY